MSGHAMDQKKRAPRQKPSRPAAAGGDPIRKPEARAASSGAAALSVWFGVVALLALVVRIALADRGEGLSASVPWLGAVASAAVLAGMVRLVARGSAPWFHWALSLLLLGATLVHVVAWRTEHSERQAHDVDSFALIQALNVGGDEGFERAASELDRVKERATRSTRLYAEALLATRRETHRRTVAYNAAGAHLDTLLDMKTLTAARDIDDRTALLRTFIAASRALLEHGRGVREELATRLQRMEIHPNTRATLMTSAAGGVEHKGRVKLGASIREAEQTWAEACIDLLGLLKESWGNWEVDATTGAITFKDQALGARYNAAAERVDRASGELNKVGAELAVLDLEVPTTKLTEARRGFTSVRRPNAPVRSQDAAVFAAPLPPPRLFKHVRYRSPAGEISAYVTPDPRDGQKHPAVLWAHGGFAGIGTYFWDPAAPQDDRSARAFREAGLVLMCPSFRGENDNPGSFEMFYGEVDDLLAARDHLAALPYVDPDRIYLAGHSAGGTLVMLAAGATDRFRAAFAFGGYPEVQGLAAARPDAPFDPAAVDEVRLRSPSSFAGAIKRPTYYFQGIFSADLTSLRHMQALSAKAGTPFFAHVVYGGSHVDILDPLTRLVARKIVADTAADGVLHITSEEIDQAFAAKDKPAEPAPTAAPR